jgi:hypothetical protein
MVLSQYLEHSVQLLLLEDTILPICPHGRIVLGVNSCYGGGFEYRPSDDQDMKVLCMIEDIIKHITCYIIFYLS